MFCWKCFGKGNFENIVLDISDTLEFNNWLLKKLKVSLSAKSVFQSRFRYLQSEWLTLLFRQKQNIFIWFRPEKWMHNLVGISNSCSKTISNSFSLTSLDETNKTKINQVFRYFFSWEQSIYNEHLDVGDYFVQLIFYPNFLLTY